MKSDKSKAIVLIDKEKTWNSCNSYKTKIYHKSNKPNNKISKANTTRNSTVETNDKQKCTQTSDQHKSKATKLNAYIKRKIERHAYEDRNQQHTGTVTQDSQIL